MFSFICWVRINDFAPEKNIQGQNLNVDKIYSSMICTLYVSIDMKIYYYLVSVFYSFHHLLVTTSSTQQSALHLLSISNSGKRE